MSGENPAAPEPSSVVGDAMEYEFAVAGLANFHCMCMPLAAWLSFIFLLL